MARERTRVFRKPYATGTYRVSVQMSYTDRRSAERMARALDRVKALAALEGLSFSRRLLVAIEQAAEANRGA